MNKLKGVIQSIESSSEMSIVDVNVNEDIFHVLLLEGKKRIRYSLGDTVTLAIKETEVGIAKDLKGAISFRNRFEAMITTIDRGAIVSQVTLTYNNNSLRSIITSRAVEEMKLTVKDRVQWLVKANEISLLKDFE